MSTQLNEMGAWFFLKDEGVGDWKSGEIRIGQSPTLRKTFFEFLGYENTKNDHLSLMRQRFTFPHDVDWTKTFLETQLGIHAAASKQKQFWIWTLQDFPLFGNLFFHDFGFPIWIVLSHVFPCLLVVFLNTISLNPIWCLCFERPAIYSFWYFCSSRSGIDNVQKFVNFCVCM